MFSRSVVFVRGVVPVVGGVLLIFTAVVCFWFAVWFGGSYSQFSWFLITVGPGTVALVLGLVAGMTSLVKRRFWLATTCGVLSLIPAFWVFLVGLSILSFKSAYVDLIRFPVWLYIFAAVWAPAVVGLVLIAVSRKEFS